MVLDIFARANVDHSGLIVEAILADLGRDVRSAQGGYRLPGVRHDRNLPWFEGAVQDAG